MKERGPPAGKPKLAEAAPKTWKEGMERQRAAVREQHLRSKAPPSEQAQSPSTGSTEVPPPVAPVVYVVVDAQEQAFQVTERAAANAPQHAAIGSDDLMSQEQQEQQEKAATMKEPVKGK